jgi:PBSX family phage terminase large subunit
VPTKTIPNVDINIQLHGIQNDFVSCQDFAVALITGVGYGKGVAICAKVLLQALEEPGSQICVTAPTIPMLRDATLLTWWKLCPRDLVDYSKQEQTITFKHLGFRDGSRVVFRSTSEPDTLRGMNLCTWAMDEAAFSSYEAWRIGLARVRLPGYRRQMLLGTTPKGFNWCYDLFGNPKTRRSGYTLFRAASYQNPHLDDEFVAEMYRDYGETLFKQEVEGDFVSHMGLVYHNFDVDTHVGTYPWDPTRPTYLGVDFGFVNPYSIIAIQMDQYGRVFIVDEEYRTNVNDEDMVSLLRGRPYWGKLSDVVCDNANPDRIDRLRRLIGVATPAEKGRISTGITQVRSMLDKDSVLGTPMIFVDKRCDSIIKEFNQYAYAEDRENRNTDETPIDKNNHSLSALRYWITTKWSRNAGIKRENKPSPTRIMPYQRIGTRLYTQRAK